MLPCGRGEARWHLAHEQDLSLGAAKSFWTVLAVVSAVRTVVRVWPAGESDLEMPSCVSREKAGKALVRMDAYFG